MTVKALTCNLLPETSHSRQSLIADFSRGLFGGRQISIALPRFRLRLGPSDVQFLKDMQPQVTDDLEKDYLGHGQTRSICNAEEEAPPMSIERTKVQ